MQDLAVRAFTAVNGNEGYMPLAKVSRAAGVFEFPLAAKCSADLGGQT